MEIKKLYESGILTKDEMEAEKNKVLHPEGIVSEEPKAEEPISEEISSDATPVMQIVKDVLYLMYLNKNQHKRTLHHPNRQVKAIASCTG